jgi:hypothetical protein
MDHFVEKYNIRIAKKDSKFRSQYPFQADRLAALEEDCNVLWEIHTKDIAKHLLNAQLNKKK